MLTFDNIYHIVIGADPEDGRFPWVKCVAAEGSPYDLACDELREAYVRLCGRLGIEAGKGFDDSDMDTILDDMLIMQREVACAMFLCGIEYGKILSNFKK